MSQEPTWGVYRGTGEALDTHERDRRWPPPPPWRDFRNRSEAADLSRRLGHVEPAYRPDPREVAMVNAAITLRRPLLVTGRPGSGKSSLAYRITRELRLGPVLRWPVTSRTTLRAGLYEYDAIGRARAAGGDPATAGIGDFVHLGPLGTAFLPAELPRVLLVDEMDKGDFDLPNDLLNLFEDGEFTIPELVRLRAGEPRVTVHTADPGGTATVHGGVVGCHAFPIVVITSNGERDFPAAFLRRCLHLEMPEPTAEQLAAIVAAHFPGHGRDDSRELITAFLDRSRRLGGLAADQLLNAVQLATSGAYEPTSDNGWGELLDNVWNRLSADGPA